jgi:hypothetical protein
MLFTKGEVPLISGGDSEVPFFASIGFNVLYVGERSSSSNRVVSYNLSSGGTSANTWHHLAVTMKESTRQVTIYIDGVQKAQGTLSGDSSVGNTKPVRFGRNGGTGDYYWEGKLDDIRIWNVTRTASEIAANYDTLSGSTTSLVGRWRFDEGSGTTAADSTSPGQNATLQGGATWSTDVHP